MRIRTEIQLLEEHLDKHCNYGGGHFPCTAVLDIRDKKDREDMVYEE